MSHCLEIGAPGENTGCVWLLSIPFLVCFRNWCSYVVTRTISCHVQNGTYLQRVLQNCPWPMSCPGNR